MTVENKSATKDEFTFSSHSNFTSDSKSGKRTFDGITYSGGLIDNHYFWGDLVFDLENLEVAEKCPALINHEANRRAGFVTSSVVNNDVGIQVFGNMLTNSHAQEVIQDADDGFPWQMSVHIEPGRIDTIETGEVTVNGRVFSAPITVFRNNVIREAGFVAVGADKNTSATVFNRNSKASTSKENIDMNELEKANAEIETLKSKLSTAEAENKTLSEKVAQFSADQRKSEIQQLAKDAGREFSEEDFKQFSAMDSNTFSFMSAQIRASAPTKPGANDGGNEGGLPENMFSHQAQNGMNPGDQGADDLDSKFDQWANRA